MLLQDKMSYEFPVKDIIEEGRNQYYIVENDGVEYKIKLYDFQKNEPRPATLKCLAMQMQDLQTPYLVQDYSQYINRFYQIGSIYPFKVVSVHINQPRPYYKVRDSHGFTFRLLHQGAPYLEVHDSIKCRAESINGYRLRLKLVTGSSNPQLKFYTIRQLATAIGVPSLGRLLERVLDTDPRWQMVKEFYIAKQGEWVLRALELTHRLLDTSNHTHRHFGLVLKTLVDLSLFLLEGSSFLKYIYDDERAKYQLRLERYVSEYQTTLRALELLHSKRDEEFVTTILSKMRNSGYLYNPGENLDLLMAIFTLHPETVDKKMADILDIIIDGSHTNWMLEPFRSAFLRQLDYYVSLAKERTDRASHEDAAGRDQIHKMQLVLALQMLMTIPSDKADLQVNRAALYRYLTYDTPGLADELIEKAFNALTDNLDGLLEFNWRDLDHIPGLSIKVTSAANNRAGMQSTQIFEGANTMLHIAGSSISILPAVRTAGMKPLLPHGLLPWHDLQVYCNDRISPITADQTDYRRLSAFWLDVEASLFNWKDPSLRPVKKHLPHPGDTVDIVVDSVSPDGKDFTVHVSDDNITGEGHLALKDIVPYNIEGLQLRDFRDDDGNAYRLRALVKYIRHDGTCDFSMVTPMRTYTNETCSTDDEFTCLIFKRIDDKFYDESRCCLRSGYVGISSLGDSIMCVFPSGNDPMINRGEIVVGTFDHVSSKGQVICNFDRIYEGEEKIGHIAAFRQLMANYNDFYESGIEKDTDDEDELQANILDVANVRELIRLIDRVATLERSKVRMFNYLAFCRLLSRMAGDDLLAEYYQRRMSFLDRLRIFLDSGYVDVDNLRLDEDGFMDYPRLQKEVQQLRVLSYFDHPEKNEELWRISTSSPSDNIRSLARLALLSNMAMEFKFDNDMREQVNREVSSLLNIPLRLPALVSFGKEETQTLEFKSSYFCPADSLRPDPERQRDHIMQRICGFINSAEGGTIYIGVNNYGVASGLDTDIQYVGGNRERLDLRVRNDILKVLGPRANALVSTSWADDRFPDKNKCKDVYRIDILPCPDGVDIAGAYWVRQGTSTHRFDYATFKQIQSDRQQLMQSHQTVSKTGPDENIGDGDDFDDAPRKEEDPADGFSGNLQPPMTPEPIPSPGSRNEPYEKKMSYDQHNSFADGFSTGILRPNPCHDWEDRYVVPHFFVHLYGDDAYEISTEETYETDRSLAIRERELDAFVVAAYADGAAIAVPVAEFDIKERNKRYSRYRDHKLCFASVGREGDRLLIIYRTGNMRYARMEAVSDLRHGSLNDTPMSLTSADFDEVICCEIIPEAETPRIRTLLNVSNTSLGKPLDHPQVYAFLTDLGIIND